MTLFEAFPLPWVREGEDVRASNGKVVYCDTTYYPYSQLSEAEWDELIKFVNEKAVEQE